jgi:two-component system, OmpR family, KDP operon response regulator KdpE
MKILVIDSELQSRRLLRTCLERKGYEVVEAATGSEGIAETMRVRPGAVLLDMELPDIDGSIVLKRLREWGQAPVLVVSASAQEAEGMIALDDGAQDCFTTALNAAELLAPIRDAQQLAPPDEEPASFRCGDLEMNSTTRTVRMKDHKVQLTSTEFSLLALFIKHVGRVLTHGSLMREIWGTTDAVKMGRLRGYMAHLRRKLQPDSVEAELSFTETGIGYRLVLKEKSPLLSRQMCE